jgi:hypothetical protein
MTWRQEFTASLGYIAEILSQKKKKRLFLVKVASFYHKRLSGKIKCTQDGLK